MNRRLLIGGLVVILGTTLAPAQVKKSNFVDPPVTRIAPSLQGVDSVYVYSLVGIPGLGISTLRSDIQNYIAGRFDSIGVPRTRELLDFNTGYVTVYIGGMTRSLDEDDAPDEIQFTALMQLERYVQVRNADSLHLEKDRPLMAATWKKTGVAFCHIDSLEQAAFKFIGPWTDTLLMEYREAND